MAAIATSGASDLLRGMPCWSTTISRTVRRPRSRIWLATASAAAACSGCVQAMPGNESGLAHPGDTGPVWRGASHHLAGLRSARGWLRLPVRFALAVLDRGPGRSHGPCLALAHDLQHRGGEVVGFDVGERQERLGPLHAVDLEDLCEQQFAQVRVIPDAQPDEQVKAAGHDAHVLGLWHRPDGPDDLAQVHAGPGRHREVDDDGEAERRPVDVHPVAADDAVALQPGKPVGHRGRGHLDGAGEGTLGLARVGRQRAQQRQVKLVDLDLRAWTVRRPRSAWPGGRASCHLPGSPSREPRRCEI